MRKSAEGSAGFLHQFTKPQHGEEVHRFWKQEEEDARFMGRCEAMRKEWAKPWQCGEIVQNMEDKRWKNEELKEREEALNKTFQDRGALPQEER